MTNPPIFCFVIPCFNEEDNVGPTVGSIREAMGGRSDYEIILVNDASTDRTLEQMLALAAADPRIHVLDNPTNLGFGGSYKRGASVATATYVMMLPGDDGFPGQSIAEILGHAGEADIIIPIVTNRGARHWFRAFASKGFTTLLNWAFWLDVGYYNGAVLQRNELLRSIEITTNSFAYQAEALVKLIARGQPTSIATCLFSSAPRDARPPSASRIRLRCGERFCVYSRLWAYSPGFRWYARDRHAEGPSHAARYILRPPYQRASRLSCRTIDSMLCT